MLDGFHGFDITYLWLLQRLGKDLPRNWERNPTGQKGAEIEQS